MTEARTNLLGLTRPQLEEWVLGRGGKAFRARQLMELDVQARRNRISAR